MPTSLAPSPLSPKASPTFSGTYGNGNLTESEKRSRVGFMSNTAGTAIWHHYIVATTETDAQGEAAFSRVKAGDYWLYSLTRRPAGQWVLWNVKTSVKFYDTTNVKLDNSNITFTVN